jgi:N-methylhydantoinase A/oxoprolinase/acetone carboxylase beta subunit
MADVGGDITMVLPSVVTSEVLLVVVSTTVCANALVEKITASRKAVI